MTDNDNKPGAPRPVAKEPPPGTHVNPDPDDKEALLDEAVEESFPASDPPAPSHPQGWVEADEPTKKD